MLLYNKRLNLAMPTVTLFAMAKSVPADGLQVKRALYGKIR